MNVSLHRKQCVTAFARSCIRFRHRTDTDFIYSVSLNWRQFQNLNDIVRDFETFKSLKYYPLGGGVFLFRNRYTIKLINNRTNCFFRFYESSWKNYLKCAHPRLFSYLRDGESVYHQPHARNESDFYNRLGGGARYLPSRYKTISRPPRNASDEDDKRSMCSNVSRRQGTNSRLYSHLRGGKHATRIHREIEEDQEYARFSSDEADNIEHGSECSISEEDLSTKD